MRKKLASKNVRCSHNRLFKVLPVNFGYKILAQTSASHKLGEKIKPKKLDLIIKPGQAKGSLA
jgi:hypothetical protein